MAEQLQRVRMQLQEAEGTQAGSVSGSHCANLEQAISDSAGVRPMPAATAVAVCCPRIVQL